MTQASHLGVESLRLFFNTADIIYFKEIFKKQSR